MKNLIRSLSAVFLVLIIVFSAVACAYGSAGTGATTETILDESDNSTERYSENSEQSPTQEACMPASEWFSTIVNETTKPQKNDKRETASGDIAAETDLIEDEGDDSTGSMTLEVNEVGDGWFTACHPWPSPLKYKIIYDLGGKFNSGDNVEVTYDTDEYDENANPIVLFAKSVKKSDFELQTNVCYKPVIYLYPEKTTKVSVKVNYNGRFTSTIPEYGSGWNVTAYPDGHIVNSDGAKYDYLFWEGVGKSDYDLSKGFCVKGSDAEKFLCEKLTLMGMNQSEINDFNSFWVPYLEKNPYNRICFQTTAYTDNADLLISPQPDSVLRVFMVYTPLEVPIQIKPQTLDKSFKRTGFTVVEWGGAVN